MVNFLSGSTFPSYVKDIMETLPGGYSFLTKLLSYANDLISPDIGSANNGMIMQAKYFSFSNEPYNIQKTCDNGNIRTKEVGIEIHHQCI